MDSRNTTIRCSNPAVDPRRRLRLVSLLCAGCLSEIHLCVRGKILDKIKNFLSIIIFLTKYNMCSRIEEGRILELSGKVKLEKDQNTRPTEVA